MGGPPASSDKALVTPSMAATYAILLGSGPAALDFTSTAATVCYTKLCTTSDASAGSLVASIILTSLSTTVPDTEEWSQTRLCAFRIVARLVEMLRAELFSLETFIEAVLDRALRRGDDVIDW